MGMATVSLLRNLSSLQYFLPFVPSFRQLKPLSTCPLGNHQRSQPATLAALLRQQLPPRASANGLPPEILEDPKFVPIKADDPQFGQPAMMLMGFTYNEVVKIQELLQSIEGDFLKVLMCTHEMIKGTLWDALHTEQSDLQEVKTARGVPRICFLSGLTGEEMMMFVRAFPEAKVEPTVFAALVPNNAQKTVEELMDEIMGDHERLRQKADVEGPPNFT